MKRSFLAFAAALLAVGCSAKSRTFSGEEPQGGGGNGGGSRNDGGGDAGTGGRNDGGGDAGTGGGPLCAGVDCSHLDGRCMRGVCIEGECFAEPRRAGTECAAAAGECDAADTCDGAGECVANQAPEGAACTGCPSGACGGCAMGVCTDGPAVVSCGLRFTDVTAASGLPATTGSSVVAWLDVENDGDPDVFLRGSGLYINDGAGVFTEGAAARGIRDVGTTSEQYPVIAADFDNDGDMDIFVANDTRYGTIPNRLYRNDGTGTFMNVALSANLEFATTTPGPAVWIDHDRDNDLDLFFGSEFGTSGMFRNDGALPFADDSARFSTFLQGDSAAWADPDADGDLDLYVATGSTGNGNRFFRFTSPSWTDVATSAGLEDTRTASSRWGGATWIDIDADGDLDLLSVRDGDADDLLYYNAGAGAPFSAAAAASVGLGDGSFLSASVWADWDQDGDLDAYVGDTLYRNDAGTFAVAGASLGIAAQQVGSFADIDGDGDLDLLTTSFGGTALYRRDVTGMPCRAPGYAVVRVLTDRDGNATDANVREDRDAIGARVDVDLDGDGDFRAGGYTGADRVATYLVGAGQWGNRQQSQLPLIIGMGAAASVDIRVTFPDGSVVTRNDVPSGARITINDV
ncbi:FG-GAP repeat domain-containing protein [Sorangium sp. So ce693]|uniref:FG-GAP repeat domain-containing protein n=1 Tax=Sorangium sp. So ce693 TaxID=3133318 RepID=UPI003F5DB513